ncbi:Bloom syndrome homolog isoform X1 [Paramuricea clavata]|uniref:DNA 3'-5' helicase n=1 Tax=Paramuricea clavata TaxID=317549 RepID=A0A7D9I7M1_PARCT|nr:Bloom syndrome homolog isoform X1 [Paramuricea clavata]
MSVCYINSMMPEDEKDIVLHCLSQKDIPYDILFITPEALLAPQLQAIVKRMSEAGTLSRIVVDEAHCVDTWGDDFRPSYSNLSIFKEHNVQIVAFTGTATEVTAQHIIDSLKLSNPTILRMSLDRPNLVFKVLEKKETKSMEYVSEMVINKFRGLCGIVYCFSTRDTLDMAYHLKQRGVKAVYYHGQLDLFKRNNNATTWLEGRSDVMCSTNAFGMGIDKRDVRFVIHHSMPKSNEEYFQEAGRAGRDGSSSSCILLFRFQDRGKLLKHISEIEDDAHK